MKAWPRSGKGAPVALAINKIDRVEARRLLGLTKELNDRFAFAETFMISAEKGHGVETLRTWLAGQLPEGPWLYPEDQIADLPMRMIAAEMTREKLTLRLHQELPYQLTVETENWEERKDGSARIDQMIYVVPGWPQGDRAGQQGRDDQGGVSKAARAELEEFLGPPVHLVPAGEGAGEMAGGGRALFRDGSGFQRWQHLIGLHARPSGRSLSGEMKRRVTWSG